MSAHLGGQLTNLEAVECQWCSPLLVQQALPGRIRRPFLRFLTTNDPQVILALTHIWW